MKNKIKKQTEEQTRKRLKEHFRNFYYNRDKYGDKLLLDLDGKFYHLIRANGECYMFPVESVIFRT